MNVPNALPVQVNDCIGLWSEEKLDNEEGVGSAVGVRGVLLEKRLPAGSIEIRTDLGRLTFPVKTFFPLKRKMWLLLLGETVCESSHEECVPAELSQTVCFNGSLKSF